MKTKFILHGGFNPNQVDEDSSYFYSEILKDAPENAKILIVLFAKDDDRIPMSFEKISSEFNNIKWQNNIIIEIADRVNFLKQLVWADVVYFSGGVSLKLRENLKNYPDMKELLKGKIVAGESAGANVLCKYFYSPKAGEVFEGLSILPIKICPHFINDFQEKLDKFGPELEVLQLREYEFKVIHV
jgi:peptidase E